MTSGSCSPHACQLHGGRQNSEVRQAAAWSCGGGASAQHQRMGLGGSTWGLRAAMRCGLGIQGSACPIKYKRPPSPGLHMSLHCPYHMIMSEISSPQPRLSSSPDESTHPISQRPERGSRSMVPKQLTLEQAESEPGSDTAGLRVVLGTSTDELRESFFRACHAEWNSSVPWEARHQS